MTQNRAIGLGNVCRSRSLQMPRDCVFVLAPRAVQIRRHKYKNVTINIRRCIGNGTLAIYYVNKIAFVDLNENREF